jgi:aspartate kinase
VVVVSAMGKTTDELVALAKKAGTVGVVSPKDAPRRELDMLVSTGERISMALLSIALHARGADAISFTGSQSGIITNDRHFDARIIEVRPHRIEDELARGRIVIVAGYQGMSYRREITTLGRGGSDTTAVALAAALGAERCEIYSDVDGVYSADPRVVDGPLHLPSIDLAVLQEMAEAGAKVLNAQAVEWARRAKITLYARKTSDPVDEAGGHARQTVASSAIPEHPVRAVASMERVVLLRAPADEFSRLVAELAELSLPAADMVRGDSEATVVLPLLNVPDWELRRSKLVERVGEVVRIEGDLTMVSLVGDGLTAQCSTVHRFHRVLAPFRPKTLMATPLRLSAVIESTNRVSVERALHAEFVET